MSNTLDFKTLLLLSVCVRTDNGFWLCSPINKMAVRKDSLVAFCTSSGRHAKHSSRQLGVVLSMWFWPIAAQD